MVSAPRPPTRSEGIHSLFDGGLFLWLLEDGARRPPSYYDVPCRFCLIKQGILQQDGQTLTRQTRHTSSRTVVSVPRPPARSEGIHSPLRRGTVSLVVGGRGTEATVLLFLLRYDGDAAKNVYLCSWLLILEPVISSSLVYWQHVRDMRNLRKNINPCTDVGKQFYI